MKSRKEKDVYELYGLDRNDPETVRFVSIACAATGEYCDLLDRGAEPYPAFNRIVKTWVCYSDIPPQIQSKCELMVEVINQIWVKVSKSETVHFCRLCDAVSSDDSKLDEFCHICLDLLEATTLLDRYIPGTNDVLTCALSVAEDGRIGSNTCKALLYILCARIWYKCLGFSCNEEEAMLSEGVRIHTQAKADNDVAATELYAIHIAAAIHDIICVRIENRGFSDDIVELLRVGYNILSRFDSPSVVKERQSLYKCSGITEDEAFDNDMCQMSD